MARAAPSIWRARPWRSRRTEASCIGTSFNDGALVRASGWSPSGATGATLAVIGGSISNAAIRSSRRCQSPTPSLIQPNTGGFAGAPNGPFYLSEHGPGNVHSGGDVILSIPSYDPRPKSRPTSAQPTASHRSMVSWSPLNRISP